MKTILFFDRCDLTDLYISISKGLVEKYNVVHVAFSEDEKNKLESAGILKYVDYQEIFDHYVDSCPLNYEIIQEIDELIIKVSNGRFNLNSSIQSDRGYAILTYEESLLLAQSHYLVWKEIFSQHKVDLMHHEICSQFMVHIAALLCKNQGGIYRYTVQCSYDSIGYRYLNVDGENYSCPELETNYKLYNDNPNLIDKERCLAYIDKYRSDYSVFFGTEMNPKIPFVKIVYYALISYIIKMIKRKKYDKLKNNISYWLNNSNLYAKKLSNICDYKIRKVNFVTDIPKSETYYYYSIHLEPEATVLYLGDGIYENQIKLIQNIAASLPVGSYLYVKDHPHEYAYRDACDYERLMKIPNIRLIHQSVSGKQLIANAKGVFSINGTAGLEALLLGKQVFCMGNSYYSCQERVNVIRNIRDIREIVYSMKDVVYEDDDNLYAFVYAYLTSSHEGFTSFFSGRHIKMGINMEKNGRIIAEDIIEELN